MTAGAAGAQVQAEAGLQRDALCAPACLARGPMRTQTPEPCRLCTASVSPVAVCPGCDPRAHTLDSELIGSVCVTLA